MSDETQRMPVQAGELTVNFGQNEQNFSGRNRAVVLMDRLIDGLQSESTRDNGQMTVISKPEVAQIVVSQLQRRIPTLSSSSQLEEVLQRIPHGATYKTTITRPPQGEAAAPYSIRLHAIDRSASDPYINFFILPEGGIRYASGRVLEVPLSDERKIDQDSVLQGGERDTNEDQRSSIEGIIEALEVVSKKIGIPVPPRTENTVRFEDQRISELQNKIREQIDKLVKAEKQRQRTVSLIRPDPDIHRVRLSQNDGGLTLATQLVETLNLTSGPLSDMFLGFTELCDTEDLDGPLNRGHDIQIIADAAGRLDLVNSGFKHKQNLREVQFIPTELMREQVPTATIRFISGRAYNKLGKPNDDAINFLDFNFNLDAGTVNMGIGTGGLSERDSHYWGGIRSSPPRTFYTRSNYLFRSENLDHPQDLQLYLSSVQQIYKVRNNGSIL